MQKFRLDNEIKRVDIGRQKKREDIEYIEKEGRCGSMYGKNVRIGEKTWQKMIRKILEKRSWRGLVNREIDKREIEK